MTDPKNRVKHQSIGRVDDEGRLGDCAECGLPWPCPSSLTTENYDLAREVLTDRIETWAGDDWKVYEYAALAVLDVNEGPWQRMAGWCVTHHDFAWQYLDESVQCLGALVLETSTHDCMWQRTPVPTMTAAEIAEVLEHHVLATTRAGRRDFDYECEACGWSLCNLASGQWREAQRQHQAAVIAAAVAGVVSETPEEK